MKKSVLNFVKDNKVFGIALFVGFCGLWFSGLSHPYIYDDQWTIVKNESIHSVLPIHRFFLDSETVAATDVNMHKTIYRPLPTLSFAIQNALSGLNPLSFRIWNVVGHFLGGILLLVFLRRWGNLKAFPCLLAVGIFWFHPVQVETVHWITQRSNIFCFLFSLLSLILLLDRKKGNHYLWGGLVSYGAALLSKEWAIVLPFLFLVAEWDWKKNRKLFFGLVAVSLAYLLMRYQILGQLGQREFRSNQFLTNWLVGRASWWEYLKLLIFPAHLTVSHHQYVDEPVRSAGSWIGLMLEIGFLLGCVWSFRKKRWALLEGMLWIYFPLILVLGFFPTDTFVAERFLYFSVAGFGWLIAQGMNGRHQKWKLGLSFILLLLFWGRSFSRIQDFKTEVTLWESATQKEPENAFATSCLAVAYQNKGEDEKAIVAFKESLKKKPSRELAFGVLNNLSLLYLERNEPDKALEWINKALSIHPQHPKALLNKKRALAEKES
ncbi:hypothetical protein BVX98_05005 [bacterium F11]|nr:hypothetical protein BVX98_05005 [bacterium F11]